MDKLDEYIRGLPREDLRKDELKDWIKEAIREWLSEKIAEFGVWSLKTLAALALAGLVYLAVIKMGHT